MKEQFNRDIKNVLKKNKGSIFKLRQQHHAAMKKLYKKHGREAAVLKYGIRRLKEELQSNKGIGSAAESGERMCQAKHENVMLKQMITQLEAENAYKNKNLDNVIAKARNTRIKVDKQKLRERLAQLEAEDKKLNRI
nr:unnamed protein product [Callosobruchus chinensis]